ncbi:MAG: tRNA 4-thiouridine(8) synthase ThiI [Proteobacteria bacterium]|nr:tRNA 4-thiouridine(8) synthase ThiI [Pseudomonadota bacterium]
MNERFEKKVRALGLCSGGLDSILSALVLRDQGIEVSWVSFETPFFPADKARKASAATGVPLRVERITGKYMEMLKNPRCGFGRNMNPCMDCHALMFRLAGEIMEAEGMDFLFSGEVVGQRPMSQTRQSLRYVEKQSGWRGRILRPLSAKKLDPTPMEIQGLVDRERLLDFSGRSRKPQMALAESYGITRYPTPAGGCLLTDVGFSRRLADLLSHQEDVLEGELELLKHGRHFRLDAENRAVVGRTLADNEKIENLLDPSTGTLLCLENRPGPRVLLVGPAGPEALEWASGLCAAHARTREGEDVTVLVRGRAGERSLNVKTPARELFTDQRL